MHRVILLFFCIVMTAIVFGQSPQSTEPEKDGTVVVVVTEGDVDNSPAGNAYVEAYGFVPKYDSKKSFVLKMVKAGRYEAALPPGVYDVFVSEGTSNPRCKRMLVIEDRTEQWSLKLEHDYVYLQKSATRPNQ